MKLSRKTTILLLVILLTLAIAVATVSAAGTMSTEVSGLDNAIAATDMQGEAGTVGGPISANIHRLISPWSIDDGRSMSRF